MAAPQKTPPPHRRTGFEVAGWDGARWILEGVFESGAEAASQAKLVLTRRLGVKVTEEVFNAAEGVFKSRVVFTEFRGNEPGPRPEKGKKPAEPVAPARAGGPAAPSSRTRTPRSTSRLPRSSSRSWRCSSPSSAERGPALGYSQVKSGSLASRAGPI